MKKGFAYPTFIGNLWIAESDGAITNISFSKPEAITEEETNLTQKAAQQLAEYFEGERKSFDLPLNPQGTDFQKKTWDVLQQIPFGETRSYKQQAELIGNPNALRAIGMGNSRNPIMIVIPCHRVIGNDGKLTGYAEHAGGLKVKRFLIHFERVYK